MSVFDELLSFSEAAEIWGLEESTLRKAVARGKLVPGTDCRKFGKQWVITVAAMGREFKGGMSPWSVYKAEKRKAEKAARELDEWDDIGRSFDALEANIKALSE